MTAQAFLAALYPEPLEPSVTLTRRALRHDDGAGPAIAFYPSWSAMLDDRRNAALNRAGFSVYFGVAPRRGRDGTKGGCASIPAIWVDLDAKDFHPTDRAAGKAAILDMLTRRLPPELQPSAIIDTGGGYQCYWFLREPAVISSENLP